MPVPFKRKSPPLPAGSSLSCAKPRRGRVLVSTKLLLRCRRGGLCGSGGRRRLGERARTCDRRENLGSRTRGYEGDLGERDDEPVGPSRGAAGTGARAGAFTAAELVARDHDVLQLV